MAFQASCPACGAPIEFTVASSVVTVCPSCRSAVGRGGGALENLGKVADLVQTDSPLKLGMRGKFRGVNYEITGRAQIEHSAGGVWDEWYTAFRGGQRWGWLAEAQGRLYLTFERDLPGEYEVPPPEALTIDDEIVIPKVGSLRVAEVGQGRYISAEGEIPYALAPGEVFEFADLSGAGGRFATIDWGDARPTVYVGGEVSLEQIGLADAVGRELAERRVAAVQVNCPNCGGPLDLKAPDETLRVGCPFCGALLDCDHGKLRFLEALKRKKVEPQIPLGTVGTIDPRVVGQDWTGPQEYTVIGFLQRMVVYEGTRYFWEEYLLYRPRAPFAWLTCSERHWSFGESVAAGDVYAGPRTAKWDGRDFTIYDRSRPEVTWVVGEFYWKINVGERAKSSDYIAPPWMLSRETSDSAEFDQKHQDSKRDRQNREINYTVLHYVPVEEVEKAFGIQDLPRPTSVAPNQPYPNTGIYKVFGGLLAAAVVIVLLVYVTASRHQVYQETFQLAAYQAGPLLRETNEPLYGGRNVEVSVTGSPWVYVDGELIDPKTGAKESFGVPAGERVYLPAMSAGRYELRMTPKWESMGSPSPNFTVTIREGVPHFSHLVWLLVGLAVVPVAIALHHVSFASRRWQDSDYSPFSTE